MPLIEKLGFNSISQGTEWQRARRTIMRATKDKAAAVDRMSQIELLAALPAAQPAPPPADSKLVAAKFGKQPAPATPEPDDRFALERLNRGNRYRGLA